MRKYSTILIDDELQGLNVLSYELGRMEDQVDILGKYTDPQEGLEAIRTLMPDLVFLDIEMPWMNGFELLDKLDEIDFDVVFVTAFDQFAIKAFRYYAVDYLLKPVDAEMLRDTLQRIGRKQRKFTRGQLQSLMHDLMSGSSPAGRIALPTLDGLEMIKVEDIIRCEASDSYSFLFIRGGAKLLISRPLRYLDELLADYSFFRAHQSHLVNLKEVLRFVRAEGGYLVMSDNTQVYVARRRKEALLELLRRE